MQQIERYGVMVLLLMLVTILVVSLWDGEVQAAGGPDSPGQSVALAARAPARATPANSARPRQAATRQRETRSVPLGAASSQAPARASQRGQRAGGRRANATQTPQAQGEMRTVGAQLPQARPTLPVRNTGSIPVTQSVSTPTNNSPVTADGARSRRARYASGADSTAQDRTVLQAAQTTAPVTARSEPAARPARAAAQVWTYEIKQGDTLAGIASRVLGDGQRWREIQDANAGLDPRRLMVGTKISLPGRAGSASAGSASMVSNVTPRTERARSGAASSSSSGKYVVRKGDVLSRVAQDQLGSASRWREIVALNPGLDPDRMHVGAKLVMPGRPATSSPRASSADSSRVAVAQAAASPAADSRFRVR